MSILAEYSLIKLEGKASIMTFLLLDGENRTGQNIGSLGTPGDHIGEKVEISNLSGVPTTLVSSPIVPGVSPLTLGKPTSTMKLDRFTKKLNKTPNKNKTI